MKAHLSFLLCFVALGLGSVVTGAETEPAEYTGLLELQVGTAVNAVQPGDEFLIGLHFRHDKGYHTYWKSPGVVGVPAVVDWQKFPQGFEAGEMQWPAPQKTLMATLNAWGYETDTTLLVPIAVPDNLGDRKEVTFQGRIGWMCCAATCHPGWHDFSLTLPVAGKGEAVTRDEKWEERFEDSRARFPKAAPEGWKFQAMEVAKNKIQLVVQDLSNGEEVDWSKVYFFSDDNQVDSDARQQVTGLSGLRGAVFAFVRPDFAPKNPAQLSGVLHYPDGWPDLDGHPWMIASAPWPEYEEPANDGEDEKEEEVR